MLEAFGLGPLVAAAFKAGFVGFVVTTTCHTTIHTCARVHARTHTHTHTPGHCEFPVLLQPPVSLTQLTLHHSTLVTRSTPEREKSTQELRGGWPGERGCYQYRYVFLTELQINFTTSLFCLKVSKKEEFCSQYQHNYTIY